MMTNTRIEIIIDELILHGFPPEQRHAIGESMAAELQRLVADNPADFTNLASAPVLRASNISLKSGAKSQMIGAQVAKTVHNRLSCGGK